MHAQGGAAAGRRRKARLGLRGDVRLERVAHRDRAGRELAVQPVKVAHALRHLGGEAHPLHLGHVRHARRLVLALPVWLGHPLHQPLAVRAHAVDARRELGGDVGDGRRAQKRRRVEAAPIASAAAARAAVRHAALTRQRVVAQGTERRPPLLLARGRRLGCADRPGAPAVGGRARARWRGACHRHRHRAVKQPIAAVERRAKRRARLPCHHEHLRGLGARPRREWTLCRRRLWAHVRPRRPWTSRRAVATPWLERRWRAVVRQRVDPRREGPRRICAQQIQLTRHGVPCASRAAEHSNRQLVRRLRAVGCGPHGGHGVPAATVASQVPRRRPRATGRRHLRGQASGSFVSFVCRGLTQTFVTDARLSETVLRGLVHPAEPSPPLRAVSTRPEVEVYTLRRKGDLD